MANHLRVVSPVAHKPRDYDVVGVTSRGRIRLNAHRATAVAGQVLYVAGLLVWWQWPLVGIVLVSLSATMSAAACEAYRRFWLSRVPPACASCSEED